MPFILGIDIGSVFTKAVALLDNQLHSFVVLPSRGNYKEAAEKAITQIAKGLEGIKFIAVTGIGAGKFSYANILIGDIPCNGRGVNFLFPQARTIVEIGGQSSKVIKIDEEGNVVDFIVGERCAAGSGRFLQLIAKVLDIGFEDIGPLSLRSKNAVEFSTGCAVFAESEAISRISEGAKKEDILAGVHRSMAAKILTLIERVGREREIAITGGGAKDIGLVKVIEEKIGVPLLIPKEPLITAALGAAIIGREKLGNTSNLSRLCPLKF